MWTYFKYYRDDIYLSTFVTNWKRSKVKKESLLFSVYVNEFYT